MKDQIFLLDKNKKLIELDEADFITEDEFQNLLENHPQLISGSQINPEKPRKWILISREIGIPGEEGGTNIWSLDHLFIDQDGIPTLVEVKRSTDSRIRREVVGQMLDYAANSVSYWSIDEIKNKFEGRCEASDKDPELELSEILDDGADSNEFWERVDTNLKAGKIRLLFVADKIPRELQRIIEFLNEQMAPAEVLGVEIKQYSNNDMRTLVPRVIGQTSIAQTKKSKNEGIQWDIESFLENLESRNDSSYKPIVLKILEELKGKVSRFWFGKGVTMGSIVPVLEVGNFKNQLFAIWTAGHIEIYFQYYKKPFNTIEQRKAFLEKLNMIDGISISDDKLNKRPSISLAIFKDPDKLQQFLDSVSWFISETKREQS